MVQNTQLTVKYITTKDCFVYLPHHLMTKLPPAVQTIKVSPAADESKVYYLSFQYSQRSNDYNSFGISSTFAQLLDLNEGVDVNITVVDNLPALSSLSVTPRSKEDLEIIKLRSDKLQSIILLQINVVAVNQPIVIWLSKSLNIVLYADNLSPKYKYGKLLEFTEVHVQETVRDEKKLRKAQKNDEDEDVIGEKYPPPVVRINPLPTAVEEVITKNYYPIYSLYNVFIHLSKAVQIFSDVQKCKYFFCRLKKIPLNYEQKGFSADDYKKVLSRTGDVIVKMIIIENNNDSDPLIDCHKSLETIHNSNVFGCKSLMDQLDLKLGSKVFLEKTTIERQEITSIEVIGMDCEVTREMFYSYINQLDVHDKVLIDARSILSLAPGFWTMIVFLPETVRYGFLSIDEIKKLPVEIPPKLTKNLYPPRVSDNEKKPIVITSGLETIVNDCKTVCELRLKTIHQSSEMIYKRENILICGSPGSGKTILCEMIQEQIQQFPYLFHVETVNCKRLKGKTADVINRFLTSTMLSCVYYQPCILFLDNIDIITNSGMSENEENTLDAINAARVTDSIINVVTHYQSAHCINVIATASGIDKLGSQFKTLGGIKFFNFVYHIPSLEKEDRLEIFREVLKYKKLEVDDAVDWNMIADKTEGFVVQDLVTSIERASFEAWRKAVAQKNHHHVIIDNNDFVEVFKSFIPFSLRGVSLYTGDGYGWDQVGGLKDVKKCLVQMLQWPLTYTELFSNAPVKQQSGILLYGMPGTGKTMIAGAVARECGLHFISIKGPELLSKYIGASEEAVRDLFERAQRAKPCVLFFDEFESLAPRRGHDSTGVTDRVVNQLLTQLDGIEGREGIAIVAASSRPDLLDPALLRPGRLDKSVLCPLPQEEDRLEILKILCNKFQLNPDDFDLELFAKKTEGFTGADFNAMFNQSRVNAIEHEFAKLRMLDEMTELNITQEHLLKAMESTHPSLTPTEVTRFNKIYEKFSQGDNFTEEIINNPKATLA